MSTKSYDKVRDTFATFTIGKKGYSYTEDNFTMSRRSFLMVGGAVVAALAIPAYVIRNALNERNEYIKARTAALYQDDVLAAVRESHNNSSVLQYYKDFGGEPMGELSHHLLHTHYVDRSKPQSAKPHAADHGKSHS